MKHVIEKQIEINSPLSRVWRALTDYQEFGSWFGVKIDAAFAVGQVSRGHITYPGYEHIQWEAVIKIMEPERAFAFTWHPYAIDPQIDYSQETPTLVEFTLQRIAPSQTGVRLGSGTLLKVRESGFEQLPAARLSDVLRMNDSGWAEQMNHIAAHVKSH